LSVGVRWADNPDASGAGQRWPERGSIFLSRFFAYFFINGKSMKKKSFKNSPIIH